MKTLTYILTKYNLKKNQSRHELHRSRWGSLSVLFKELKFNLGAEIGVETGRYSKCLCTVNPKLKLYAVDNWATPDERIYNKAKKRLAPFNCQIIRDASMNAVKRFADESLDFVFIDAAHDYQSAMEDIKEWSKKVRKGGIVAGHDYNNGLHGQPRGVKGAVNKWAKKNKIKPLFIFKKDGCPTWFYVQPVALWEKITKGIIYYTDNILDEKIMKRCQEQLMKAESPVLPIISVSLKPIAFGQNYVVEGERGYLTAAKQIIKALEEATSDVVFFCEHDVLYHPSHFAFTPTKKDVYYYNTNSWMLRAEDGHCLYYDHRSLSGMCCYRETALAHFRKRKERIEALLAEAGNTGRVKAASGTMISLKEGIHRLGFEPGTHNRPERIDDLKAESFRSEFPNVDIRHKNNLTQSRFRKDQFRNSGSYQGWTESDSIPGWGKGKDILG